MRIRYTQFTAKKPQASLGGGFVRHRPLLPVRVFGAGTWLADGHPDTGADDTVFPLWVAGVAGVDLSSAVTQEIMLAGRGRPVDARFVSVRLRITDGRRETYEWTALVGFVPVPLRNGLLGQAGFLQFFNADFRGADREVILTPNHAFPGQAQQKTAP